MPSTYDKIDKITASGSSAVTFTAIPSTYTDLILICQGNSSLASASVYRVRYNNDSGSNYSDTNLFGTGSTAASGRDTSQAQMYLGEVTSTSGTDNATSIMQIMNYANSTTYKTTLARGSAANTEVIAQVGLWRSTSAINRIDLFVSGGTLTGSFTLYGIKAA